MEKNYYYEADWRIYAFPEDESHLASEDEIKDNYKTVVLKRNQPLSAGGLPILSDGKTVTLNPGSEMSIIFGATGSKKSRTLIAPQICILAQAGESMIIPDIKGELCQGTLSPQIHGALKQNGYRTIVLNFRGLNWDGYNLLLEPYQLYRTGYRNEAMSEVNHIINALASIYKDSSADPFWKQTAIQYLMAVTILMFEMCDDPAKINILSLICIF